MALKIRLRRMGRKNAPTYRIVVAESSMPRDGRIVENLGHYNPRTEPLTLKVDRTRALHWIDRGAVPTETAKALLKRAGIFRPEQSVVAEAVEGVVEGTKSVAKKAADSAKTATAKAATAAKSAAEEVRETAADVVEDAREAAAEVVEEVREAAAEAVEEVRERVEAVANVGKEGGGAPAAEAAEVEAAEDATPA